jgi:hypothetical protein
MMASPKEAFSKFRMWKELRTVLKLTVLEKGELPETFIVDVASIYEDPFLVGFAIPRLHSFLPPIDLSDASFELGNRVLKAERPTGDLLRCEEVGHDPVSATITSKSPCKPAAN